MKIVKWLIGLVLLVGVAFLALGWFVQEYEFETSIEIDAPVARTFEAFNDTSTLGEWIGGIRSMELVSGEPGQVGAVYRLTIADGGETFELIETVTAWEQDRRVAFRFENELMVNDVNNRFESTASGGTRLVTTNRVDGANILWNAMLFLAQGSIESKQMENYRALKRLVESGEYRG